MWGGLGVPVWGGAAGRCSVETLTNVDKPPVYKCRLLQLENTQIVLGEIQRCSKQSVDIARLQMQTAGFDKCKMAEPTNPDICSEQIHMYDFDKSTRARYTDVIFETWHMHMLERSVIQIITHIEKMIGHNHFDVKIINEVHILEKW